MNRCCNSESKTTRPPGTAVCPKNGREYPRVSRKTLLHQISIPWTYELPEQGYYFCDDPGCEVVYFGQDQRLFLTRDLRHPVGQKSSRTDRKICYCFDIEQSDLASEASRAALRAFVTEKTQQSACSCETANPSGRCCLKDFPGTR